MWMFLMKTVYTGPNYVRIMGDTPIFKLLARSVKIPVEMTLFFFPPILTHLLWTFLHLIIILSHSTFLDSCFFQSVILPVNRRHVKDVEAYLKSSCDNIILK